MIRGINGKGQGYALLNARRLGKYKKKKTIPAKEFKQFVAELMEV